MPDRIASPGSLAAYYAIRAAMAAPLVMGLTPALGAATTLARAFSSTRFNRRRIERATEAIVQAFPARDGTWARQHALRSYEHLFRLGIETLYTPRLLTEDGWLRHVEVSGIERALRYVAGDRPTVLVTGHVGNWEVLGYTMALLGFRLCAVYRPLDLRPLDRWLREVRGRRGLTLMDKRGALRKVPEALARHEPVAFVADQNAGDRGMFVPFFGRLASTYKSVGMAAIAADAAIVCGYARRMHQYGRAETTVRDGGFAAPDAGSGFRYRMECTDVIMPEDWKGRPDPLFYVTARYRRAIERMVLAAPEQYLWMHRMWKSRPRHERSDRPFPDNLRRKLAELPWMTDDELERIVDRSDRDRAFLSEHGLDRLP